MRSPPEARVDGVILDILVDVDDVEVHFLQGAVEVDVVFGEVEGGVVQVVRRPGR